MASTDILNDIEDELSRVRSDKAGLLDAVRAKEAEELQLEEFAGRVRAFLSRRSAEASPPLLPRKLWGLQDIADALPGTVSTVDAAAGALRKRAQGDSLDTNHLIAEMQASGYVSGAQNVYLSVFGILNRAAKRPGGPIVKVDKKWALREWFPGGVPVQSDDEQEETPMVPDTEE